MSLCVDCKSAPKINKAYCRECKNRRWREHYVRNKAERRERSAQWRIENPEKRQAQIDRMNAKYAQSPPTAEQRKAKYERSIKAHLSANARRRAHELNQFVEDVDPQLVFAMAGGICGICNEQIDGDFHVDHIRPISKGGLHAYVNVQPAHPLCNLRKGARCES